jgi:hypothetical protein
MRTFPLTLRRAALASFLFVVVWLSLVYLLHWESVGGLGLAGFYLIGLGWIIWALRPLTPVRALVATGWFLLLWAAGVFIGQWPAANGLGVAGLYLIGLAWITWALERRAQRIEQVRTKGLSAADVLTERRQPRGPVSWNPLDPTAWYYGQHSQRFHQTLAVVGVYSLVLLGVYFLLLPGESKAGIVDPFELPGGGGSDSPAGAPIQVRVQKVVVKKFVINPYSSILFQVPDIDKMDKKIDLKDLTKHEYQAGVTGLGGEGGGTGDGSGGFGSGSGSGGGFGIGTGKGKLRFIRLKHNDRFWDKNFGIGGDQNLWNEFTTWARLQPSKIADKPEYVDFAQLAAFPEQQAPPFLFVAGVESFNPSQSEKHTLRQYLLERHGMLFADSLGRGFNGQFNAVMREITGVDPVAIPRDDPIHRRPFAVPTLPIVVAHGGTVPHGWKIDGRWVVYAHPGAISDAWRDDHAGIKRDIWEECYRLGINVTAYSFLEYAKWQESLRKR